MTKESPLISVCIPVYGTEPVLERCLLSVADQDFKRFEVIIVSDASPGKDEKGRDAEKIAKSVLKKRKIPYIFYQHNVNLGIIETRRDAVCRATGEYIFTMDSDDFLGDPRALSKLYETALETQAEIINSRGRAWSSTPNSSQNIIDTYQNKLDKIVLGKMEGRNIFRNFLVEGGHLGFIWAKLIKRSLFEKAFDAIPCTFCTMAEDTLLYFFLSFFATSYFGVEEKYYCYSVDEGVSSSTVITTLDRWHKVCSASSVFNVLFDFVQNNENLFSVDERNTVRFIGTRFLANNLFQLKDAVAPQLQPQAYALLCEMWGEDYVRAVEELSAQESKGL